MLFAINDDQIGEYGRIEIAIRYLVYSSEPRNYLPIYSWKEVLKFIADGYFPEFLEYETVPRWVENMPYDGDQKIKKRLIKKWCKKLFNDFGEPERVKIIHSNFDKWLERIDNGEEVDFSY